MVRASTCRFLNAKVSKAYFQLLKSEDVESDQRSETQAGPGQAGPTNHLPGEDIMKKEHDPRPRDINSTFLYQHLGSRFDGEYMSVRDPRGREASILTQLLHGRNKGRRPGYMNLLRAARFQGGLKIKLNVTKSVRAKLEKFLWSYTVCPIKDSWKFLGLRFWPPWIREGSCLSERSCSIPAGMTCKESAYAYKVILRWECAHSGHFCRWRPFPYRITTNCACAC